MDVSALQSEFQAAMEYRRRVQALVEEHPWGEYDDALANARRVEDDAWLALYRAQRGETC